MASQKVHGITIELDANTSGVSQALKDVNKDIRSTQSELKSVDKLLKLDPKNVVLLTQKQGLLTDAINSTKEKLNQLEKARAKAEESGEIDKNSKQYRELERDIIATRESLEKLTKEAEQNEKAMRGEATELDKVGDSLKDATKSSSTFGDVLKANIVSNMVIGGVKALANAFKEVSTYLFDVVKDGASYADEINTLAKQYNLTTKQAQQYQKASELIDVDINTIAKSMTKLTKTMNSENKTSKQLFKDLGVSVKDSEGKLRSSNDVFNEVIEALGKIENETEQDAVAMEIFGKSASDLGPLINGGVEKFKELNKYLEENNLLLSQEELDSLNALQDGFDKFNGTVDGIKKKIAVELAPIIQPIIDEIISFINEHQQDIYDMVQGFVDFINDEKTQDFFKKVKELGETLLDVSTTILDDIITKVGTLDEKMGLFSKTVEAIEGMFVVIGGILDALISYDWSNLFGDLSNIQGLGGASGSITSGGYGALESGGFASTGFTSNLTINVNNNGQQISYETVRGWANIINEELGMRM